MSTPEQQIADGPVFAEQWQAEALAMADLLIQNGQVDAKVWAQTLGEQLAHWQAEEDSADNYYQAVLAALQVVLQQNELLAGPEIAQRQGDWEKAYLSTPHGKPVVLNDVLNNTIDE